MEKAKHKHKPHQTQQSQKEKASQESGKDFAFNRENYKLLLIGLALISVGFLLMIGGGSDNPNEFNEAIFNHRRITVAPILILAGYVVEIFAIMKKPKD
ncbi:MAG: DUF3098 domain-containing protein [Bacteroidales bacterium]|nr:DUF3098 domain-containing protein [Bacteroidales bacterium]